MTLLLAWHLKIRLGGNTCKYTQLFLGSKSISKVYGILNQSEPTIDTSTITENISSMDVNDFESFVAKVLGLYWANSNDTALPNTFLMPMDDYLGLGIPLSAAFPLGDTRLDYMLRVFKQLTNNGGKHAQRNGNVGMHLVQAE